MTTILLIILLIILLRPVYRVYKVYRQYKKAYNDAFGRDDAHSRSQRQDYGRQRQEAAPAEKKKVFTKDMGEYVAYEEMSASSAAEVHTPGADFRQTTEEQIVDAEWEELPPER